jgi:hypothetical protein
MIKKSDLYRVKYYLVFLGMLLVMFVYAGVTGWKILGTESEKWSPKEEKGYHK